MKHRLLLSSLLTLGLAASGCGASYDSSNDATGTHPPSATPAPTSTPTQSAGATPTQPPSSEETPTFDSGTPTPAPTSSPLPDDTATPYPDATPTEDHTPAPCDDAEAEPFIRYMSADDSNSQADPAHARQTIQEGNYVNGSLRMYEVYNYHTFNFDPAEVGELRITPQMRRITDPTEEVAEYELVIGVTSPYVALEDRRPYNLTFSIDTSGSMGGKAINNAKFALTAIADGLREGDIVSLVDWNTEQDILLDSHPISGPNDSVFLGVINALNAGGGTNLEAGLRNAYNLANKNRTQGAINRVVLMSDGGANVGVTSAELIARQADDQELEGIYLVGIGTSSQSSYYSDDLMDTVTDLGKGAYLYVDSEAEAKAKLSGDGLTQVMDIAARDVQLSVVIPGGFKENKFYGEQISGDPREVEPQHLSPNDSMLYHLTLLDCLKNRDAGASEFTFTARWRDPNTYELNEASVTASLEEMLGAPALELEKAFALTVYGEALAEVLNQPYAERRLYLESAILQIKAVNLEMQDPELTEVVRLLEVYQERF